MSLKQVELMCADCAVTVYPKSNSKEAKTDSKGRRQPEFREIPQEELDEVNSWWEKRQKELKRKKQPTA